MKVHGERCMKRQHASESYENIVRISADTDVMLLCMFVNSNEQFPSKICLKRSTSKIVEIPKLISAVGTKVQKLFSDCMLLQDVIL